jgi:hypothetical protein
MSPESDNIRSPLPNSGRKLPDPARSMARSRLFWPDPAGLFGIRQYSSRNLVAGRVPATRCCRTLARLDSDDRQLLNSDNQISNIVFRKLKKILRLNRKRFSLTIIFVHTKHRKIPKSFSTNHFTPKQTEHKIHIFHFALLSCKERMLEFVCWMKFWREGHF